MLPFGFYNFNIICPWDNERRCSKNSAVCAGKIGIGIVRTKKNEHNRSTSITNMFPFGFYNHNIKLFSGDNERHRSKIVQSVLAKLSLQWSELKRISIINLQASLIVTIGLLETQH